MEQNIANQMQVTDNGISNESQNVAVGKKIISIFQDKSCSEFPEEDGEIFFAVLGQTAKDFFCSSVDHMVNGNEKANIPLKVIFEQFFSIFAGIETTCKADDSSLSRDAFITSFYEVEDSYLANVSCRIGFDRNYLINIKNKISSLDNNEEKSKQRDVIVDFFGYKAMQVFIDCFYFCSLNDFDNNKQLYGEKVRKLLEMDLEKLDKDAIISVFGRSSKSWKATMAIPIGRMISLMHRILGNDDLKLGSFSLDSSNAIFTIYACKKLGIKNQPIYREKELDKLLEDTRIAVKYFGVFVEWSIHSILYYFRKKDLTWGRTTALFRLAKEYVKENLRSYNEWKSQFDKHQTEDVENICRVLTNALIQLSFNGCLYAKDVINQLLYSIYTIVYDPQIFEIEVCLVAKEIPSDEELRLKKYVNGIEYIRIRDTFRRLYNEACRKVERSPFFLDGEVDKEYMQHSNVRKEDFLNESVSSVCFNYKMKEPKTNSEWETYFNCLDELLAGLIKEGLIAVGSSPEDFRFRFTGKGKERKSVNKINWTGNKGEFCYLIFRMATFEGLKMPSECLLFFDGLDNLDNAHLKNSADHLAEKKKKKIDALITSSFENYKSKFK